MESPLSLITLLSEGDMRTTGAAQHAAEIASKDPSRIPELLAGMEHTEPGVRMRCADALQKVATQKSELLLPYTERILTIASISSQQEVQWHCAQILRTLPLNALQRDCVQELMIHYLSHSNSAIVKADALETLAYIATLDSGRKEKICTIIEAAMLRGSAAVTARGRKVLRRLAQLNQA